jgi:lipid-A-disaccharide synthase-like uncharacterized protein
MRSYFIAVCYVMLCIGCDTVMVFTLFLIQTLTMKDPKTDCLDTTYATRSFPGESILLSTVSLQQEVVVGPQLFSGGLHLSCRSLKKHV